MQISIRPSTVFNIASAFIYGTSRAAHFCPDPADAAVDVDRFQLEMEERDVFHHFQCLRFFTARWEMTSILVFCGRANFLMKVRDGAADSRSYL